MNVTNAQELAAHGVNLCDMLSWHLREACNDSNLPAVQRIAAAINTVAVLCVDDVEDRPDWVDTNFAILAATATEVHDRVVRTLEG
jgi:hypothetical protein